MRLIISAHDSPRFGLPAGLPLCPGFHDVDLLPPRPPDICVLAGFFIAPFAPLTFAVTSDTSTAHYAFVLITPLFTAPTTVPITLSSPPMVAFISPSFPLPA